MKTKVKDLLEQLQQFDPNQDIEFQVSESVDLRLFVDPAVELDRVVSEGGTVIVKLV